MLVEIGMNLVDGTLRLSDSCSDIRRIQSALKKEMHQQIACIYRFCVLPSGKDLCRRYFRFLRYHAEDGVKNLTLTHRFFVYRARLPCVFLLCLKKQPAATIAAGCN